MEISSLMIQEVTFRARKEKKKPLLKSFSYLETWNFPVPSLKKFLYFRIELAIRENQKFLTFLFKHKRKRKKLLLLLLRKRQNFLNENTSL